MMKELALNYNKEISNYLDVNRDKLDETLISLRFMKQVDHFLENQDINQKELAEGLKISPAFISQLMSGTKKINTRFINKFEKTYNVKFKILIEKNEARYLFYDRITSGDDTYFHFKKNLNYPETINQDLVFSTNRIDNEIYLENE